MATLDGKTSNQARIMIWSTPRSVSTAFARSMSARGDTDVFWEPYRSCYAYGPQRELRWSDDREPELLNDKYTYNYVNELLNGEYPNAKVLFVKGMVQGLRGHFDDANKGYKHSFLIRHPRKSFRSCERIGKELLGEDIDHTMMLKIFKDIYHDLERFYHYVQTEMGQPSPPIIDADDLVTHPDKILPKYCEAMGIEFTPKMLEWDSVDVNQLNWHCTDVGAIASTKYKDSIVLSNALKGRGFGNAPDLTKDYALSPSTEECAVHALPAYERLYNLRTKP